jgi:hypothetical protein
LSSKKRSSIRRKGAGIRKRKIEAGRKRRDGRLVARKRAGPEMNQIGELGAR